MFLFAHFVGLLYPAAHFRVEFLFGSHPQIVRVAALVERLDFVETRIIDAPRQNEMTDKVRFSRHAAGKAHARLKNNPRLLRDDMGAAAGLNERRKLLENDCYLRLSSRE